MRQLLRWIFLLLAAILTLATAAMGLLMPVYAFLAIKNWVTGEYDAYLSYGTVGWEIWQRFDFDVTGYAPGHAAWHPLIGWLFDIDRFWGAGIIAIALLIPALILYRLSRVFAPRPMLFAR